MVAGPLRPGADESDEREAVMRSLHTDEEHFALLDELKDGDEVNTVLAASYLVQEYPNLRAEMVMK